MAETTSCDRLSGPDWALYYRKTGHRPPRPTLVRALDSFDLEGRPRDALAVDLGCGSGRDTIEILRRGWPVLAVDAAEEAIAALLARDDLPPEAGIRTLVRRHEELEMPRCDLANAGFSLPLCPRPAFPAVWCKIVTALRSGGRFSGQFFGERDSWSGNPSMTHLSRSEAERFLSDLEIEHFEEEEDDSVTPRGEFKHWHIFHIVGRKP